MSKFGGYRTERLVFLLKGVLMNKLAQSMKDKFIRLYQISPANLIVRNLKGTLRKDLEKVSNFCLNYIACILLMFSYSSTAYSF